MMSGGRVFCGAVRQHGSSPKAYFLICVVTKRPYGDWSRTLAALRDASARAFAFRSLNVRWTGTPFAAQQDARSKPHVPVPAPSSKMCVVLGVGFDEALVSSFSCASTWCATNCAKTMAQSYTTPGMPMSGS